MDNICKEFGKNQLFKGILNIYDDKLTTNKLMSLLSYDFLSRMLIGSLPELNGCNLDPLSETKNLNFSAL